MTLFPFLNRESAPSPLTIRMRHIDMALGKLATVQPRTEATLAAIDFYLDRRLAMRVGQDGGAR